MSDDPTPLCFRDTARNLLFGLLALQNGFIGRDALVAAFGAWIADKSRPLDRILLDKGQLDADCHALLTGLVRQHLQAPRRRPRDEPGRPQRRGLCTPSARGPGRPRALPPASATSARPAAAATTPTPRRQRRSSAHRPPPGGRFRVLRLHAEGGLGEVYVARDEEVRREVALKQIKSEHAHDPQGRARFLLEAEITGGLEHPGIVPVYGLGTYDDGRPYYAMRFIKGDSLKDAIAALPRRRGDSEDPGRAALALQKLLRRFLDVCDAVAYAHSRGVLHRDLKPGNIMLGDYGETLVVDWGLAKAVGHHLEPAAAMGTELTLRPESGSDVQPTAMGSRLGTPAYMPPGAGRRPARRAGAPQRRLQPRGHPLRPADRPGAVRRARPGRPCCGRSSAASSRAPARSAPGSTRRWRRSA